MAVPTTAELADHVFSYAARNPSPGWEELPTVLTKAELTEIFADIEADPDDVGHPLGSRGSQGEPTYEGAIDWVKRELLPVWERVWERKEEDPDFVLYESDPLPLPVPRVQEQKREAPKYPAEALTIERKVLVQRVKYELEAQIAAEDGGAGRLDDIVATSVPELATRLWRQAPHIDTVDEAIQWLVGENPFYEGEID